MRRAETAVPRRAFRLALVLAAGAVLLTVTGVHYLAPPAGESYRLGPPGPPPAVSAHDGPAVIAELESRPLRLPLGAVGPDFRCPAAPAQSGPVRLHTPARAPDGISVLLFSVGESYAGALLVRGERLDGGATMSFQVADGLGYDTSLLVRVPVHRGAAELQVAASSGTGCWAVAVDGYRLSEVFIVNLR